MIKKPKTLIICILIPLAVGALAAFLTRDAMETFGALDQPPLSPPAWLFPVVWTLLYTAMGVASYLVVTSDAPAAEQSGALTLYAIQLIFNFFWSLWFFGAKLYTFAFLWLIVLEILIYATMLRFSRISKPAGKLFLPYFLWVLFAGYLNVGIAFLN